MVKKKSKDKDKIIKDLKKQLDKLTKEYLKGRKKKMKDPKKYKKVKDNIMKRTGLAQSQGDIAMAVPSSIGVIGQSITDKKLRKKIKSGDSEAIQNLAFAPLALVTGGMMSGATKGLKGIGKGLVRGLSKLAR